MLTRVNGVRSLLSRIANEGIPDSSAEDPFFLSGFCDQSPQRIETELDAKLIFPLEDDTHADSTSSLSMNPLLQSSSLQPHLLNTQGSHHKDAQATSATLLKRLLISGKKSAERTRQILAPPQLVPLDVPSQLPDIPPSEPPPPALLPEEFRRILEREKERQRIDPWQVCYRVSRLHMFPG